MDVLCLFLHRFNIQILNFQIFKFSNKYMPYRQIIAAAYDAGVGEEYCRLAATPADECKYRLITEHLC
jgi:hypothetical protein